MSGLRFVAAALLICVCGTLVALAARQANVWARYEPEMQDVVDDPPDALRKGEFSLGRLRYYSPLDRRARSYFRWGIDANKGDRLFISLLDRLTRIDAAPIETIFNADDDEIFDHPFLIAISVGDWQLSSAEAANLRRYFDRGGFLMVDDFHNEQEWAQFMDGIHMIYPDAQIIELPGDHAAFHTVFDLTERIRVPGANVFDRGGVERGGTIPHWRGLIDTEGRMIIAISFNQDIGDGWEFADAPYYPEKYSEQAIRLGINYAIYATTH